MKKNKMMRLASILLVCVLLTTSVISGTFAKYVTSDSAKDTARVAKFGVQVVATGSLYGPDYLKAEAGNTPGSGEVTVASFDHKNVVAPGTKSTADGLRFAVTGEPEVKVAVRFDVTVAEDVFLAAKDDLPDMTTGKDDDTFDNADAYYPVKYTLKQQTLSAPEATLVDGGTLAQVKTALEGLNTTCEANQNLMERIGTLKLTWEWDFDDSGAGTYDRQDTLLGDLAVTGLALTPDPSPALVDGTDYNLESDITISITVTQVD